MRACRVEGARWKLKMWDCIPGQDSWSSAYTVHSILLQLQVFLLDEDLQWDSSKVRHRPVVAWDYMTLWMAVLVPADRAGLVLLP